MSSHLRQSFGAVPPPSDEQVVAKRNRPEINAAEITTPALCAL
jgi:hypothetical protein